MWRTHLEDAAERIVSLEAYLKTKLGDTEQRVQGIIDLIEAHLRPSIFKDPSKEREIQDKLETLLALRCFM